MIELPEAAVVSAQLQESARGLEIIGAEIGRCPHKFAWYAGAATVDAGLLVGQRVREAFSAGSFICLSLVDPLGSTSILACGEGVQLRWYAQGERGPDRHHLHLRFKGGAVLVGCINMYGFVLYDDGSEPLTPYYTGARAKPSPYSEAFSFDYFRSLIPEEMPRRFSVKAFLATEQRIPGLGNGVLQDILYRAQIHPKTPMCALDEERLRVLYDAIQGVLTEMRRLGGRDTEADLFGRPGGYPTQASRATVGSKCARCGQYILRDTYLGGSIYTCPGCQPCP